MGSYQVPSKPLGQFNISNDKIYTRTLNSIGGDTDTNFGQLAACDTVPSADVAVFGGIKIGYSGNDSDKKYAVNCNDDGQAYVHVPWINTLYTAAYPDSCLCTSVISEKSEVKDSNGNLITCDGGLIAFGISSVPVKLISGATDLISTTYNTVSVGIAGPLNTAISTLKAEVEEWQNVHAESNNADFAAVDISIARISNIVSNDYYLKTSTSSDQQLKAALAGLSDFIFKALSNDEEIPDKYHNPSYLKSEIDSISASISSAVSDGYYAKVDTYSKDETYSRSETSSKTELDAAFSKKQDNLIVNASLDKQNKYTDKDIATVEAIQAYVTEALKTNSATYCGYYTSWNEVPSNANGYSAYTTLPDANDYIYVFLDDNELKHNGQYLAAGTWRFIMNSTSWMQNLGRDNWIPAYRISEAMFTESQLAALNSGITNALVAKYKADLEFLRTLSADFYKLKGTKFNGQLGSLASADYIPDNITGNGGAGQIAVFKDSSTVSSMGFSPSKELWTFEFIDGTTATKKWILTEPYKK